MASRVGVIGGYLGGGKTTLVNHLLETAGDARLAVLVNDFGSIAIDEQLIVARSATVIGIAGGCVCCAYGSDLIGALQELAGSDAPPDTILIETSGVALPRVVLQSATLVPGMVAAGVAVVADASTLLRQAEDRFVGDTIVRQVGDADVVLLNKVDLVGPDDVARAEAWIRAVNCRARIERTERAAIRRGDLFDADVTARASVDADSPGFRPIAAADETYTCESFVPRSAVDVEWLARSLAQPERRLLRAKGVLADRDGRIAALQVVGDQFEVRPCDPAPDRRDLGLVCIGRRGEVDRVALADLIAAAQARA